MKRAGIKKRTPLQRGQPLKRGKRLRGRKRGSLFPKHRDDLYRRAVRALPCLLRGRVIAGRISPNDQVTGLGWQGFRHGCWGPTDPAHIGPHQATGAPDRGHILPLCRAAHQFYDEHRMSFYRATGFSHHQLALMARDLAADQADQRETGAPK